jgi:hypothetical protein
MAKKGGARPGSGRKPKAEELKIVNTAVEAITEKHGAPDLFTQVDGTQYDCVVTMGSDLMNPSIEFIPVKTQELEPGLA